MSWLKNLTGRKRGDATADELDKALRDLETDLASIDQERAKFRAEREAALLEGDEAAIEALDSKLQDADRRAAIGAARKPTVERKRAAAAERERVAARDKAADEYGADAAKALQALANALQEVEALRRRRDELHARYPEFQPPGMPSRFNLELVSSAQAELKAWRNPPAPAGVPKGHAAVRFIKPFHSTVSGGAPRYGLASYGTGDVAAFPEAQAAAFEAAGIAERVR